MLKPKPVPIQSQPLTRTTLKIHRVFLTSVDYDKIDRSKNWTYTIDPKQNLKDLQVKDLLVFELVDSFNGKQTKRVKTFVIASLENTQVKLAHLLTSDPEDG